MRLVPEHCSGLASLIGTFLLPLNLEFRWRDLPQEGGVGGSVHVKGGASERSGAVGAAPGR